MRGYRWGRWMLTAAAAAAVWGAAGGARAEEPYVFPWYFSPSIGRLDYEGDEPVEDAGYLSLRLGYDYSETWGLELGFDILPKLDENFRTVNYTQQVSRLEEVAGPGVHDTWGVGLTLDGLMHFTRWERLDPYLALGGGVRWYADDLGDGQLDPMIRAGGGVMYHFNDEWAVRGDFRAYFAGADTEANSSLDLGLVWNWGARVPPRIVAVGGTVDSDGDGLPDAEEVKWKTDPYNPDTDGDGLSDGDEVYKWHTEPLNPDTDYDGLRDGYDEALKYRTDPTKRDTDNGGVADGHEVIEDGTNPLDPADDLILFELNIQFDYDKAEIKPQYHHDLDVIAKMLKRNPQSTARIEGHADKLKTSKADYNRRLSQRRAQAVLNYLAARGPIDKQRLTAVGYGFDRPKAPNHPIEGNPVNRRVEVYIRGAEGEKAAMGAPAAEAAPSGAESMTAP